MEPADAARHGLSGVGGVCAEVGVMEPDAIATDKFGAAAGWRQVSDKLPGQVVAIMHGRNSADR